MTDEEIMARVIQGETDFYEQIVERYKDKIMALMSAYLRWDLALAEEITQQTLIRAFEKRKSFRLKPGTLRAWLFRIARNLAVDSLRRTKKWVPSEVYENLAQKEPGPLKTEEQKQDLDFLDKALQKLPIKQRETIILVRQGHKLRDIAEITGISLWATRRNYSRAVQALRIFMKAAERP